MDGIYLIDKPIGMSSYDIIRKFKKAFNLRKIGHAGTLDPFASGLLVVLVGKATKFSDIFINDDKEYTGTIYFGISTNTYDNTGNIKEELNDFILNDEIIKEHLKKFQGRLLQKPPIYSAVRYEGRRLYEYAREDEKVKVKEREVYINLFKETSSYKNNKLDFIAKVSKGTYLRSLAYDFGKSLNIPTHLTSLRRTRSGMFKVSDAYKVEDIKEDLKPSITIEDYANTLNKITVKPYLEIHVSNGILLDERQTTINEMFSVYNNEGELLAIYKPKEDKYSPLIIVKEN